MCTPTLSLFLTPASYFGKYCDAESLVKFLHRSAKMRLARSERIMFDIFQRPILIGDKLTQVTVKRTTFPLNSAAISPTITSCAYCYCYFTIKNEIKGDSIKMRCSEFWDQLFNRQPITRVTVNRCQCLENLRKRHCLCVYTPDINMI